MNINSIPHEIIKISLENLSNSDLLQVALVDKKLSELALGILNERTVNLLILGTDCKNNFFSHSCKIFLSPYESQSVAPTFKNIASFKPTINLYNLAIVQKEPSKDKIVAGNEELLNAMSQFKPFHLPIKPAILEGADPSTQPEYRQIRLRVIDTMGFNDEDSIEEDNDIRAVINKIEASGIKQLHGVVIMAPMNQVVVSNTYQKTANYCCKMLPQMIDRISVMHTKYSLLDDEPRESRVEGFEKRINVGNGKHFFTLKELYSFYPQELCELNHAISSEVIASFLNHIMQEPPVSLDKMRFHKSPWFHKAESLIRMQCSLDLNCIQNTLNLASSIDSEIKKISEEIAGKDSDAPDRDQLNESLKALEASKEAIKFRLAKLETEKIAKERLEIIDKEIANAYITPDEHLNLKPLMERLQEAQNDKSQIVEEYFKLRTMF